MDQTHEQKSPGLSSTPPLCTLPYTYTQDGESALMRACYFGHIDVVRSLLYNKAHFDLQNEVFIFPLFPAHNADAPSFSL